MRAWGLIFDGLGALGSLLIVALMLVICADVASRNILGSSLPLVSELGALMVVVLGGLYSGFFTPTEAGAIGAAGALVIALARRSLNPRSFRGLLVETGQITVSVLFLIMAATFFSRMLAMSGLPRVVADLFLSGPLGAYGFLLVFIALVIVLGFIIDSISIILILLPIALPVASAAGFDLIWFGVITVIAVEIGLLTPPFGLSVYTIKSAMGDPNLRVGRGARAGACEIHLERHAGPRAQRAGNGDPPRPKTTDRRAV